jgi:hypothetical protein
MVKSGKLRRNFGEEVPLGNAHSEDRDRDGRNALRWILGRCVVRMEAHESSTMTGSGIRGV